MKAALDQAFTRVRPRLSRPLFGLTPSTAAISTSAPSPCAKSFSTSASPARKTPVLNSSRGPKLLQIQATLHSYITPFISSPYSTTTTAAATTTTTSSHTPVTMSMSNDDSAIPAAHQSAITRILDFWFTPPPDAPITAKWFGPSPALDAECRALFSDWIAAARTTDELESWTSSPRGSLALLLLLDQFPRNIFRGSPDSYAADPKAVRVASRGVARGFDRHVGALQSMFFYLPFMHAEDLARQVAGVALYEGLLARCVQGDTDKEKETDDVTRMVDQSLKFAKAHRDVILWFGRFPSRNECLGRESSPEEREFLRRNPGGFPS